MGLLLASASPRRRELLTKLRVNFQVINPKVDETTHHYWPQIPFFNAIAKAKSILPDHRNELILSADTVIEFQNSVIGKPSSLQAAFETLQLFSGKTHFVTTAVCLMHDSKQIRSIFGDTSAVKFRKLTSAEITRYLELVNPLDKAGAYGVQEYGEMIIEKVDGSIDNVIGLPTEKVKKAFYSCGFSNLMTKREPSE